MCVCSRSCLHFWRLEIDVKGVFLYIFRIIFGTESLTDSLIQLICLAGEPRDPPISDSRGQSYRCHPAFYMGAGIKSRVSLLQDKHLAGTAVSLALGLLFQHFPWTSCAENLALLAASCSHSQEWTMRLGRTINWMTNPCLETGSSQLRTSAYTQAEGQLGSVCAVMTCTATPHRD